MTLRPILTSSLKLDASATQTVTLPSGHQVNCLYGRSVRNGSLGSGFYCQQANVAWEAVGWRLEAGEHQDIDLRRFSNVDIGRGQGRDGIGNELLMDECVLLMVLFQEGTGRLVVMPTTPPNAIMWISPGSYTNRGGALLWFSPAEDAYPVLDTERWLRIGAEEGNITYDVQILGRRIYPDTLPSEQ